MYFRSVVSISSFILVLAFSAPICRAQDPKIQLVDPTQQEILVSGQPNTDGTLIGHIPLVSSKAVPELVFWPTDFKREDGKETISQAQIQPLASGKLTLQENTPQYLDFKISALKRPGTYTGSIALLLPQHGNSPALRIPVKIHVEETPKLTQRKDSQNIKIQMVNCSLLRCFLARVLQPTALTEDHNFTLDNGSYEKFSVQGAASATGDTTRATTGDAIVLSLSTEIAPNPIVTIPFRIKNGTLAPDHYVGDIQLRLPAKDDPLKIPLEINVSTGPELPLLVLLLGILFGRLIKYMKDKGAPQSDLLMQLIRLQARAKQDPDDEQRLLHVMDQARQEIEGMQLDQAKADLQTIANRLNLLARLRYLETILTPRANDPGVPDILARIAQVRNLISLGADPTNVAGQIETGVQNLAPPGGAADPAARAQEAAVASSVRMAALTLTAAAPAVPAPNHARLRSVVAFLTGHEEAARAQVTLWFLRPLLYIVLIVILCFVGLMQLYFKNPIFGSDFVNDYFGLLVWATGSDVASRTLSNFKGS